MPQIHKYLEEKLYWRNSYYLPPETIAILKLIIPYGMVLVPTFNADPYFAEALDKPMITRWRIKDVKSKRVEGFWYAAD